MDKDSIASFWKLAVQTVQDASQAAVQDCQDDFADLIRRKSREFCDQAVPTTQAKLSLRQRQALEVMGTVSVIHHAGHGAAAHSQVADQILAAAESFCDRQLSANEEEFANALTDRLDLITRIGSICFGDLP